MLINALAGFVVGAILGALWARRRGGKGFDVAQYAGTIGIICAMVAVLGTVVLIRLG